MNFEVTGISKNWHQNMAEGSQSTYLRMCVKLGKIKRKGAETRKPDKQVGKGSKKVLGLQEYQDRQEDKTKPAEAAGSATNPEEEEDWDVDAMPLHVLWHLD